MKFTSGEITPKSLGFEILDLDGNNVIEFENVTFRPSPPLPGEFYSFQGVDFDLDQVVFPRFGEYTMIFRVDGVDMHRMLFRVRGKIITLA